MRQSFLKRRFKQRFKRRFSTAYVIFVDAFGILCYYFRSCFAADGE